MKKFLAAAGAALILTLSTASATPSPSLLINGVPMGAEAMSTLWNNTTYVSLRAVSTALDNTVDVKWENGVAYVSTRELMLSAQPGEDHIIVNEKQIPIPDRVKLIEGRTLIPVRILADAFGASTYWNESNHQIMLTTNKAEQTPENDYNEDELFWLSRIISAESQGEPLHGKIAVGNVVLNRVKSQDFPNTIYDVIFDARWGGQFEPVRNGTIYNPPTEESVLAAKLCLDGSNVVGDCLYFLAPALAQNFWVPQNRVFFTTIGCHDFYY